MRHLIAVVCLNIPRLRQNSSPAASSFNEAHKYVPSTSEHSSHGAGVLKYKKQAETLLQQSGLPWTILRPSRLTDGPYTSYDLNTLLQATAGTRQDVLISPQDDQLGEASRIAVAGEACPWRAPLQKSALPGHSSTCR